MLNYSLNLLTTTTKIKLTAVEGRHSALHHGRPNCQVPRFTLWDNKYNIIVLTYSSEARFFLNKTH